STTTGSLARSIGWQCSSMARSSAPRRRSIERSSGPCLSQDPDPALSRSSDGTNPVIVHPDIGLACVSDAQSIALISRHEVEYGLHWAWTAPRVRRAIEDRDTNAVVAREAGKVVGFALMKYEAERAHLLLLAVLPSRR